MSLPGAMRTKYEEFINEGTLIIMDGVTLNLDLVYEDLDDHIIERDYDVRCFGYDPYGAKPFVDRWESENGPYGVVTVPQGVRTESIPLGELKKLAENRMLLFDEQIMTFTMGNSIVLEDSNKNKKLYKKRRDQKIDNVAALMDAYVAFKENRDAY